jgi:hypothetical protein
LQRSDRNCCLIGRGETGSAPKGTIAGRQANEALTGKGSSNLSVSRSVMTGKNRLSAVTGKAEKMRYWQRV